MQGLCDVSYLGIMNADISAVPDWISEVEFVATWHTFNATAAFFDKLKSCRLFIGMGVGYNNIDIKAAGRCGIPVCNIPAYGTEDVADTALSLILALYRQTFHTAQILLRGDVIHGTDEIAAAAKSARRLRGSTLGALGAQSYING